MTYLQCLTAAMTMLSEHPRSVFLGQSVVAGGTAMTQTFADVPKSKMIELPVFEETQMGLATGLALGNDLPISVYPRINFMLLAIGQIVLHLDALPIYSHGGYLPKVIIRTAVATDIPLNPGVQHLSDYSYAIEQMLKSIKIIRLKQKEEILPAYIEALLSTKSTLLVEYHNLYDT